MLKFRPWRWPANTGIGLVIGLLFCAGTFSARLVVAAGVTDQPTQATIPFAQVVITPTKDNTLYESPTGGTSNGAGQHLFVGQTSGGSMRRALVAFDIAGQIPAGATIVSATLQLQMSKTNAGAEPIGLHKVSADWGEGTSDATANEGSGATATTGDATWLYTFFNTAQWSTDGGDFAPTASATLSVNGIGFYTWDSTPGMVTDLQSWLDAPATNFGWILLGNETAVGTAKRFSSRENATVAARPQLTVVYQTSSEPLQFVYLPLIQK
jgi:hypothetical protein